VEEIAKFEIEIRGARENETKTEEELKR